MIPISLSAGTVMAVFLTAVIVLGYVVIWAIWHFFFRGAGDDATAERRAKATPEAGPALGGAIHEGQESTGSSAGDDAPAAGSEASRVARPSASSSRDNRPT